MLNKLKKLQQQKSSEGFTIIEVMIVLAIAGLIILIVLLAVPALQRNGRNTGIKADAGAVLGAVSDFSSNNEGAQPTVAGSSITGGLVTVAGAAGTTPTTGKTQSGTTGSFVAGSAATVTPAVGAITVYVGAKCPTTISGTGITFAASDLVARSVAVVYAIESSGGNLAKCIGS